ncbi:hypothetical protein HRE53_31490 (plasmid) [Acaryochloris sp. 'Moss Beach']|uniref:hypothetical protein n=1 Tax=Acaryochloris sp. 'Moss Beach' TaxID=2740837 RepID=UPI001F1E82D6|nr:hypothetical protein [Acaryochloris sp. 'Moss Beach']UJB73228.1 hypothetical protein HRE53_31490 [Acaryochloris sp. 'Moss Beach']
MASTETPQPSSGDSVTFVIRKSGRNVFIAKMIILVGFSLLTGHLYTQDGIQSYERGRELTQEQYLEGYEEYKGKLLQEGGQKSNPIFSTFVAFIGFTILIFSYELTAIMIGFLIGKVIKR